MSLLLPPGYDYPIDDRFLTGERHLRRSSKRYWKGGSPPLGHPRRCQGTSWKEQRQCARWAIKGTVKCRRCSQGGLKNRRADSMGFFLERAQGKMKDALVAARAREMEVLSLIEEAELARITAFRAIEIFNKIVLDVDPKNAEKITEEMRARSTAMAQQSIAFVADIVEKAAKIKALAGRTSDDVIAGFIRTVSSAIETELAGHPELQRKLVLAIESAKIETKSNTISISV